MARDPEPKFPTRVKLGYAVIDILEVEDIDTKDHPDKKLLDEKVKRAAEGEDHEMLLGLYTGWQHRIQIRREMPLAEKYNTLIHELGHAIFRQYKLSTVVEDETDNEEFTVNSFANGYAELFMRNEELTDWLDWAVQVLRAAGHR